MGRFVPSLEDPPLQAVLFRDSADPWRVLVATVLLNCTGRAQVDRVWPELFERWPTSTHMAGADGGLNELLAPLGFVEQRPRRLRQMSAAWTFCEIARQCPLHVAGLPALGRYADDSYQLFVRGRVDVGLESTDRVVRGWARLARDRGLRLDGTTREWVSANAPRSNPGLTPGVDDVGLPLSPQPTTRPRRPGKENHTMSTTIRISTSQATNDLLKTGPKDVKALAETAREVAKGKGNGVSFVSETTPAQAKKVIEFLNKKAENEKTAKPLARRARTVAARVQKAIDTAASAPKETPVKATSAKAETEEVQPEQQVA